MKIKDRLENISNDKTYKILKKKLNDDEFFKVIFLFDTAIEMLCRDLDKGKELSNSLIDIFSDKFISAFMNALNNTLREENIIFPIKGANS